MNLKDCFSDTLIGVKPQATVVNGVRYTFDGAEGDQLNPLIGLAPAAFATLPVLLKEGTSFPWVVFVGTFLATDLAIAHRIENKRLNSSQRYITLALISGGAAASYWFSKINGAPDKSTAVFVGGAALLGRLFTRGMYLGFDKAFLSGDVPSEELI